MEFIALNPATAFDEAVASTESDTRLVVCGSSKALDLLRNNLDFDFSVEQIIQDAEAMDTDQWLAQKREGFEAEWEMSLTENEGEWPGEIQDKPVFTLDRDILSGEPQQDLVGTRIRVDQGWQIPAFFNYGGWNDCPEASEHCAIWRRWEQKYGAKIVGVSGDIIEAHVSNPPTTQEEAMALAMEQYLYCYDIVDQGMETIANLAALLLNSKTWYFWWD